MDVYSSKTEGTAWNKRITKGLPVHRIKTKLHHIGLLYTLGSSSAEQTAQFWTVHWRSCVSYFSVLLS